MNRVYSDNSKIRRPNDLVNSPGNALYFTDGSLTAGYNSNANGFRSLALGAFAVTKRDYAIAIGYKTLANGANSIAIGTQATANGIYSVSMGRASFSKGLGAFSMGESTLAEGDFSFAYGYSTVSKARGGIVFGVSNDTLDQPTSFPNSTDRLFQIGNGDFSGGTRSNAITILRNGNMGIGTLSPNAPLQFANTLTNRKIVLWENSNTDFDYFGFGINSGTLRYNVAPGTNHTFFAGTVALFNLASNGNATLAGLLTQLSDVRLKTRITPLKSTLNSLTKLNGYSYYWKESSRDHEEQIGLLAQEVENLYPQLVRKDKEGLLSVNYTGLIPVMIESIKELNEKIEIQQKRIEAIMNLIRK